MHDERTGSVITEELSIYSSFLARLVTITCFVPGNIPGNNQAELLLINDGQDMQQLGMGRILEVLFSSDTLRPLICVAIHSSKDRKMEYGTAKYPDYMGRGAKASAYTQFIFDELLPFLRSHYSITSFLQKSFAGFSLGGLSALDIVWNHPHEFARVGIFSASLWWRSKGLEDGYDEATDRIMHMQIREGGFYPWLKFFFEAGALDETMDRNNNGIIDSIDDTLALIGDLVKKGYQLHRDLEYLELTDGRHDIATWARAMPVFLMWGWKK